MKAQISHRPSVHQTNGGLHHSTAIAGMGNICTVVDPTTGECTDYGYSDSSSSGFNVATGSYSPASSPSTNWSSILSGITNSFTSIFRAIQPVPAGCSQVTTPQGVSSVQCLSTTQQQLGTGFNLASTTGLGGSTLILLAGGLAVILLMKR